MNYSVSLLTNRPDCQALIDMANSEKAALSYKKTGLQRLSQNATLTSAEIEAALTTVNAEIAVYQTLINTLPDGPMKEEAILKYKKADVKRTLLEKRRGQYGVISILEREYDIACIDHDIAEADAFITAVTERMSTL